MLATIRNIASNKTKDYASLFAFQSIWPCHKHKDQQKKNSSWEGMLLTAGSSLHNHD